MRKVLRLAGPLAASFVLMVSCAVAQDDITARIGECGSVQNDVERLACFDTIAASLGDDRKVAASTTECRSIKLEDLKLDFADLVGTCVQVSGSLMTLGEMALLSEGMMDSSPLLVDYANLSRDERKTILRCETGCRVTIEGIVEEVMFSNGIRATSLKRK